MFPYTMHDRRKDLLLRVVLGAMIEPGITTTVTGVSPLSLLNALAGTLLSLEQTGKCVFGSKRYTDSIVQEGKCTQLPGIWNTAITQEGKCEQAPKEYLDTITQEGKCVQNGTPTPDFPVDIVCNNGAIKYSANMVNVNEQTALVGYYINASGVVTADVYNWIYQVFIPCKPNTSYTLSMSQSVYFISISEYSTADDSGFVVRKTGSTGSNTSLTITTGDNTNFIRFGTNPNRTAVTLEKVQAINWMLNEGSTAIPYAPYADGGIYTDGTPEVLAVSWKNLFDASSYTEINAYVNANTGVLTTGSPGAMTQYCAVIPCRPSAQYKITGQGTSAWGSFTSDAIGTTATAFGKSGILTTGANDRYLIGLVRANGDSIDYRNTLVVQEAQAVSVPMLLSAGDYKDEAEIISGIKTGRVGVKVFDGTETVNVSSAGNAYIAIDGVAIGVPNTPINTHFALETSTTSLTEGRARFGANGPRIYSSNYYMSHPTVRTAADFKAWLASEYANGTPVIVLYPLATETTEQISNKITYRNTDAQISYTAEVSDITITTTQSEKSTPTPDTPLDILCNNGKLVWNGTAVVADGTPETLTVSGINLLDPSTSNITIGQMVNANGEITTAANNWRTYYIPVVGGKTYAFWGRTKADNTISAYNRINWFTANKTHIYPRPSYTVDTVIVGTAPSNAAYAMLSCAPINSSKPITRDAFDAFNWMFAEAAQEIPFEPYHAPQTVTDVPMLLGVGDYKDEAEIIEGIKTHRIAIKVFDGTETPTAMSTAGAYCYAGASNIENLQNTMVLCTHYKPESPSKNVANMDDLAVKTNATANNNIYFKDTSCLTVADLQAKFAALYAAGTPVILLIVLPEETTEQITAYPQLCNKLYDTADVTAEVDDISVTFTTGEQTIPSPYSQLPIKCNNGELKWNGTAVVADGTAEVLKIIGQNLVDLTAVTDGYYYDPSGVYTAIAVARLTDYIPVKAGQKYTVYVQAEQAGESANVRCNLFNSAKEWKSQSSFVVNSGAEAVSTITPTENGFLRVSANYSGTGAKVDWSTLQIVVGEYTLSTMPSYQPYTAQTASVENLLAVGNYKDTQEIIDGLLTHKVGIKVLDGTENWTAYQVPSVVAVLQNATSAWGAVAGAGGYCTHLTVLKAGDTTFAGSCRFATDFNIYEYKTAFGVENLAELKAFLTAQYAAGTPVIVVYPLATETSESVTPQLSHDGSYTTVTAVGEVDDIPVTLTNTLHTTPTPEFPIDILCNNGPLTYQQPSNNLLGAGRKSRVFLRSASSHRDVKAGSEPEVITVTPGSATAHAEDLLAVGTHADIQDIVSGALSRNVKPLALTGQETWELVNDGTNDIFRLILADSVSDSKYTLGVMCTNYETVPQLSIANQTLTGSGQNYDFVDNRFSTVEQWTTWLAAQYGAGMPVILLYPLAETESDTVEAQSLPLEEGTNTITVIAAVPDISLTAQYKIPNS